MNAVDTVTNDVDKERLGIIASEIKVIQENTRRIMLTSIIQIGERLAEAKAAIGHGGWLDWLQNNTNLKERQAQRAIRLWQEYGQGQQVLFGKALEQEKIEELTTTQAEILLGIKDPEERAEFVEQNDLDAMSTRELQDAIKERDKAIRARDKAVKEKETAELNIRSLEMENERMDDSITKLQDSLTEAYKERDAQLEAAEQARKEVEAQAKAVAEELEKLKRDRENALDPEMDSVANKRIHDLEVELAASKGRAAGLEKEIEDMKNAPVDVATVEKVPDEVQKELEELRAKAELTVDGVEAEKQRMEFATFIRVIKSNVKSIQELFGKMKPETAAPCRRVLQSVALKIHEAATEGQENGQS